MTSGLGRRLFEEITGTAPDEAPTLGGWRDLVAEAVGKYGSERKASAILGVDRRTWQRARAAEAAGRSYTPRASTLAKLIEGVRDSRVNPAYPGDKAIRLDVQEWRSGRRDASSRTITGAQMELRPGTMRRVAEAYRKTGDPDVMALVFLQGVRNGFYRSALGAGVDQSPTGPVDVPDPDDLDADESGDYADAIDEMYEDYNGPEDLEDVSYEDGPDAISYGFDVA